MELEAMYGEIKDSPTMMYRWDIYDGGRLMAKDVEPVVAKYFAALGCEGGRKIVAIRLIRHEYRVGLSDGIRIYNTLVRHYFPEGKPHYTPYPGKEKSNA